MIKKYFRKIHLWFGLVIGVIIFIIAITGCIYAFEDEIQNFTQKKYRFVTKQDKSFLLPSELQSIAEKALPEKALHSIKYFNDNHSVEASFYHYDSTHHYYYKMYLNPYTGKVLFTKNMDKGFFNFILNGHMFLWLPREIGAVVVLVVTLIFFLMVITGIVLWFPKNWKMLKTRIWFQWKNTTKWKRKNWDLHGIIGFYTCFFALIFIITSLVWVLPNFATLYYKAIGGKKSMFFQEPTSLKESNPISNPVDRLYINYLKKENNYISLELHPPETDSSSIVVVENPDNDTYWRSNYVYYNQYTLQDLKVEHIWGKYNEATNADKILRLNYDIHIGAVLGLTGKTIAFFASLLIATLPITGFIIWYGRKKKTTKKKDFTKTKQKL